MEWVIVAIIAILTLAPNEGDTVDICVGNCPITVCRDKEPPKNGDPASDDQL